MTERSFRMRLACQYEDPDNSVAELAVENFDEGEWLDLGLSARSPGFLVFVYAVLTCQHLYFRTNCAERGLMLSSADGAIDVLTSEDWDVTRLHVHFDGTLKSGDAGAGDVDYIVSRMKQCPVSRNMREPPDCRTTVSLHSYASS